MKHGISHSILLEIALLMISIFHLQLEHGFDLTVSRMRLKQKYVNNRQPLRFIEYAIAQILQARSHNKAKICRFARFVFER